MQGIKINTPVKGIPVVVDVLTAIHASRANIHTIDVSAHECVVVGQNVQPLAFHLINHSYRIGPNKTHMFIDIKRD